MRGEDDAGVFVDEAHFGETGNDHLAGGAVFADDVDGAEFVELYAAIVFGDDGGVGGCTTGDTTGVEGTEGELRTGFTDGLGGDDADGFTLLHHLGGGEVAAVALHADAVLGFAGEDGANFDFLDAGVLDGGGDGLGDLFAGVDEDVAVFGVGDVVDGDATEDALGEGADDLVAVFEGGADESAEGAAVFFVDDDVVGDVDKTAGEVSGVGGLQGGVGQTLTGTVGGDEVLEHGHAFLKVGEDGVLDGGAGVGTGLLGFGHETTHAGELCDLVGTTTGSGVEHHEDGVETLVGFGHLLHEGGLDVAVDFGPGVDDLVVALVVGDETHTVVAHDLFDALVTGLDDVGFLGGDDDVVEVERESAFVGLEVAEVLDAIEEFAGARHTDGFDDAGDDVAEGLLGDDGVDEPNFAGDDFVDDDATDGGFDEVTNGESVFVEVVDEYLDGGVHVDPLLIVGDDGFLGSVEGEAGSLGAGAELGDVVETEHHVLGGDGDGGAVGGVEDVVALEHQHLRLENGLVGEGKMDGHLVAVEVGVEGGAGEGVELDGFALDELGLEGLDGKTVERRGAVEEHGVAFHHEFEDVEDDGLTTVDNFLGALDGLDDAALDELADDEGLVELGGHEFGETAFAHLEFGTYDDDGTTGIVDALTEEVLAETALLTLEGVGERLEGTVAFALDGAALAAVVEKAVDGFLEHAFLIAQDDVGGFDLDETLETVVANEDATIEVVEVGGGETAAVEGNEGTEFGRGDGDDLHDHPLGFVAIFGCAERFDHLQTLEGFALAGYGTVAVGAVAQFVGEAVEVDAPQEFEDGLGAHLGDELVGVGVFEILVLGGELVEGVEVFVFGEQVVDGELVGEGTGLYDDIALVVDDHVELLGGDAKKVAHLVGQGTEIPDVCDGYDELDVSGAFATHFLFGHFHTATVADDAFIANALVLAAMALVVLGGTEDAFAEQAVALGLVGSVVDGFGLQHFAVGVGLNLFGRGQSDGDLSEVGFYLSV